MISLDIHRYDNIKQDYFKKVYASLKRMKYSKYHVSNTDPFIRELVYTLYKTDLIKCLIDVKKDSLSLRSYEAGHVDGFTDEMLEAAVKSLVLADVSVLKEAAKEVREGTGFKEWREYNRLRGENAKKKDDAAKARELQLKDEYDFLIYFAEHSYENMRNQKINIENAGLTELPECIVSALGIRTCPYCNRGFIGVTKGHLLGVQLDHFYNRHSFPLFAVSLYNLVPCCGTCNHIKSDDMKEIISPYDEDADFDNEVHFTYEIPKADTAVSVGGKRQLKIEAVDPSSEKGKLYNNNIELFRLNDAYAFQELEAEKFYEKMIAYPESRLQEIENHFIMNSDHSVKAADLEEALFREYFTEPSDYALKPMAKFYRDLYYNIKGWK